MKTIGSLRFTVRFSFIEENCTYYIMSCCGTKFNENVKTPILSGFLAVCLMGSKVYLLYSSLEACMEDKSVWLMPIHTDSSLPWAQICDFVGFAIMWSISFNLIHLIIWC